MKMKMLLELEGNDQQQIDSFLAGFIESLGSTDAEIIRSSKTRLEIRALLSNLPVQMSLEDAERLKSLLHQMQPDAHGPATLALEIVDAAILLR